MALLIAGGVGALVMVPVGFLTMIVAPTLATSPTVCSLAGPIGNLSANQSKIVETIAGRAQVVGLGDPAITTALTASLALTNLTNEPAGASSVGIFDFLPSGQWGPPEVINSSSEDALLFMAGLAKDGVGESTTPAVTASAIMNNYGVAPQPVIVHYTTAKGKKKTKVVYEQPTPAFFAPFVARATALTNDVVALATAQVACGGSAAVTLTGVGAGTLPSGYTIPTNLSAQRGEAVRAAISQIGNNYVWGAAAPSVGFDCSGLVEWAWAQASPPVALAHYTVSQWEETTPLPSLQGALPGDLVLTPGADGTLNPPNPQHVGMYIGDINGVPWVVAADDQQVGVVAQTYSSFVAGGLIAVGHIKGVS